MRFAFILLLLAAPAFAHLGEEETGTEQHSPLEILLDNPAAIITAFVIYCLTAYVFYTMFPMKKRYFRIFLALAIAIAALFLAAIYLSLTKEPEAPKPYHTHADFKVYLDGVSLNFTQAGYMSTPNNSLDARVHLHDLDGGIIHHHARNVTMADFFSSLKMRFNSTCFITDENVSYCDNGNKTIRMFVMHHGGSWEQSGAMEKYVFEDLDRILITYGEKDVPVPEQLQSVTDRACIQSEKCPGRGPPSDESTCAGDVCLV